MRKVGLICEGGGTKGAYTSGALQALLDNGIYVPYAVGISAGAENLLPYVSRQRERLRVTGVDSASNKDAVGLRPLLKEGSIFGIEATIKFIEDRAPFDFKTFYESETKLDIGLYNMDTGKIEYFPKEYLDKDKILIKAACALAIIVNPYPFNGGLYMDAGLIDMIPVDQSIRVGNERHIFISTKEENYTRKPAPKWQLRLAKWKYRKYPHVAKDLALRHKNYEKQWNTIKQLREKGNALVLRPSQDMGISRYTTDVEKIGPWFQLGYDDTIARMGEIKQFIKE